MNNTLSIKGKRLGCFLLFYLFTFLPLMAQFNTDRLVMVGRSALFYEDYVLSIQYFNQAISQKPWLFEPWFFRGVAKYYLDDYRGAESDCTVAIERNPYVVNAYELRGLCRINLKKYADAVKDYDKALRYNPHNQGLWHNRILCLIQDKNYDLALAQIDTMLTHWSKYARAYSMQAEIYLLQKDTTKAVTALEKSLELDPYDGGIWAERAIISLAREKWKEGEEYLDKSIHLMPKQPVNYINRAMARYNQNNLRGAMADYDTALDLDPNNFLGHYNRGLLRAQVGDDNRGIEDFDFVLKLEPDNLMALFNRALLLEQTGNLRAAIRDYSKVIEEYPNFWFGLQHRASCYRRLGNTKQAELDEFRILKAQMDKRFGHQPRLSKKQMRKRSDEDMEKYNQLVVADEQEVEHEYKSEYRGKVQNHRVESQYQPYISLSLFDYSNAMTSYHPFVAEVDAVNRQTEGVRITVSTISTHLTNEEIKKQFDTTDALTAKIANTQHPTPNTYLARSVAYCIGQNYGDALKDVDAYLAEHPNSSLGWWHRAVCNARQADYETGAEPQTAQLRLKSVNADFERAESLDKDNAYILYCHGTFLAHRQDYDKAIQYFTRAVALDNRLAEAYFNRGMAYYYKGDKVKGNADLSKAGELGLYSAYSIIKSNSKK